MINNKMRKRVYDKYNGRCAYCGMKIFNNCGDESFHIDHIIPKCKGGSNHLFNLNPSCRYCNLKKHDKSLDEFRPLLFALPDCIEEMPHIQRMILNKILILDYRDVKFYFERIQ